VLLAINDTAADVQAGLSTLVADATEIASITASNGPVVVSTATFLADQLALDKIAGGFAISDAAAAITANLNQLNDPNIGAITISDGGQVAPSVQQLTTDATAIGKLQNAGPGPVLLAVSDSAGDIEAGLSTLVAETGEIASITASGGPVAVSTATFLAAQPTLDKIVGGFAISDTVADVAANLNALNGDSQVTSIALTNGGTLTVSIQEALNDTPALSEITSPHTTALADTAADIELITSTRAGELKTDGYTSIASTTGPVAMTLTEAETLSGDGIAVTGAPVTASGAVAAMTALATTEASTLFGQGYILAVLDTAANIQKLTTTQIAALSARHVTQINASDTSVSLSPVLVAALESAGVTVSAPPGDTVVISGIAANLEALTASEISGLPALGAAGLVSTNASVTLSVAQVVALEGVNLKLSVPSGDKVTATDTAANVQALTPAQITALPGIGASGIVSTNASVTLSVAQAVALEGVNLKISVPSGDKITVSDTAANVQALTPGQITALPGIGVTAVSVSSASNVTLTVAQAVAFETSKVTLSLHSGDYAILSDVAANIATLTATQIAGLTALHVTQIQATDTTAKLTVAQALALESAKIPVAAPAGSLVEVSDTAANLEALTASETSGLTAIGVTGLVSTNANVSYSSTQTAAILSSALNVSAAGSYTVTENFANGNYSVYQAGQLIRQKSVNSDLSYDIAYFGVTGQTYSSYEDIYNTAAALVADAQNNVSGSGNLILYANAFTITSASGSESVTIGLDTFAVNPHFVETTTIENSKSNETFVYGSGFGQDTITGFLAPTGAGHDHLQFSLAMFGFSTATQTADAKALLSNPKFASGTANTTITDLEGDTLTLNGVTIATLQAHLADFKFT